MKFFKPLSFKLLLGMMLIAGSSASVYADTTATPSATNINPPQDARSFVDNTVNNVVLGVLQPNQANLATSCPAIVAELAQKLNICIDDITNFVVPATLLQNASTQDKTQLESALTNYLIGSYYSAFSTGYTPKIQVKTYPVRGDANANIVQVNAIINTDPSSTDAGAKIPVSVIVKKTNGGWCIGDLVIDGIDQLLSVRSQIASQVSQMSTPTISALSQNIEQHNNAQCQSGS